MSIIINMTELSENIQQQLINLNKYYLHPSVEDVEIVKKLFPNWHSRN
jgi:hypothetical protein